MSNLRLPLNMALRDNGGGLTCILGNLMYMYGLMETPDLEAIDAKLRREPGEFSDASTAYAYLLEQGFSLHYISCFDDAQFQRRGLDYLREYYHSEWTAEWDAFYTDEFVQNMQERRAREQAVFRAAGDRWSYERRQPTFEDVRLALTAIFLACPVIAAVGSPSSAVVRSLLAYDMPDENTVSVYEPDLAETTVKGWWRSAFLYNWQPKEGICLVSRP